MQAGQIVEVAAPKIEEPKIVDTIPEPPGTLWSDTLHRPFAPTWMWVVGIATLVVGGGATAGAYANAVVVHDHLRLSPTLGPTQAQITDYNGARTLAYASWAVPATLAVLTTVLTVWYAATTPPIKVRNSRSRFDFANVFSWVRQLAVIGIVACRFALAIAACATNFLPSSDSTEGDAG